MKIIRNKILPFRGFKAMAVWPFIFVRGDRDVDKITVNHEMIHGRQQIEMAWLGFFLWYGVEWLVRLIQKRNAHDAYKRVSLEQEAYAYQSKRGYLKERKHYYWKHFL